MVDRYPVFGIRHLSPTTSFHLLDYLEKHQPKCILLEAPMDASKHLMDVSLNGVVPPIALLAYTQELPIKTILYPYTVYSPEYQAILWGVKHKCDFRFIDLPTNILLGLQEYFTCDTCKHDLVDKDSNQTSILQQQIADLYGVDDYESFWENNFEHNLDFNSFKRNMDYQAKELDELLLNNPIALIRESYMRRQIQDAIHEGFSIDNIVIIAGALHSERLQPGMDIISDKELASLPKLDTHISLMPYSYEHLSDFKRYGINNRAPLYYEMLWHAILKKKLEDLSAHYCSKVARALRKKGHNSSTANAIEAVHLSKALAAIRDDHYPVLSDLHDAVKTCFGEGNNIYLDNVITSIDVGVVIGKLPKGLSKTPLQDDFNQHIKHLKLATYMKPEIRELNLDIRENIQVKSADTAFLGLNRSILFHRLAILNIQLAEQLEVIQNRATWAEKWQIKWTPQTEIDIIEANLKGETIELAAAYVLSHQLINSTNIANTSKIIKLACECNLLQIFENAIVNLQNLLVDSVDFNELAYVARELSVLIKYNDVRKFNLTSLQPIVQQLFLHASLLLIQESSCDDEAAKTIAQSINLMEIISSEYPNLVDTKIWYKQLTDLSMRDDLNPLLSGIAFSILMDHQLVDNKDYEREISRRLSPGLSPELGILWFEGISSRNRYILLLRPALWEALDMYVDQLDEDEFMYSLVFLRRALSDFDSEQRSRIVEILTGLWNIDTKQAEIQQVLLTSMENKMDKLEDLNDFDFDF